jgi:thymidylate synthase (FAD)
VTIPEVDSRFGRWTVLGPNEYRPMDATNNRSMRGVWLLCRCDCGTEKWLRLGLLKAGRSSGCKECRQRSDAEVEMGLCSKEHRHRLMAKITAAIKRCTDPRNSHYPRYGGRGITVWADWLEDPNKFLVHLLSLPNWDDVSLSMDRIENDRGYLPGNLRFATKPEQALNRGTKYVPVTFFYAPEVILISRPQIDWEGVEELLAYEYAQDGGITIAEERDPDAALTLSPGTTDAEAICEIFGRGCYGSFGKKQGRVGSTDYFRHILEAGHGSLLEGAAFGFVAARVSRGCVMQMTRHRAGWSWAIESTHFIDYSLGANACLTGLPDDPELRKHCEAAVICAITDYSKAWSLAKEFTIKKKATAAAVRGLLPTALESKCGFTVNIRALRHFIELRGAEDNVPEIRCVASQLAAIMKIEAPSLFADFEETASADGFPMMSCKFHKV